MSKFNLKTTQSTYCLSDPQGLEFALVTSYDPDWGWSATVRLTGDCMNTEDAAIDKCLESARWFLKIAEDAEDVTEGETRS